MAEIKDRLTVVEQVYHQNISEQLDPTQYESRYGRELETIEQVYQRTNLKATEEWSDVDFGWIKKVGLLLIRNDEGKFSENPTEEQLLELSSKVLEISSGINDLKFPVRLPEWIILPGENQRAQPYPGSVIKIRSASGITRYTITVIPA